MMNVDQDALECDLAETYNIYNIKELPVQKVALFSYGLREDSRIKLKINNSKYSLKTLILANIADKLAILLWHRSGASNDKPKFITDVLLEKNQQNNDVISFDTIEEFEKERAQYLGGD